MPDRLKIPMFPLTLLPLPGELVPLHIFEQRYRQLLTDVEQRDISFGIYFNHTMNAGKLGSVVKLESVIKRYPGGESDIIVKCIDLFTMGTMYRTYRDKLYPGAEVELWHVNLQEPASRKLQAEFEEFLKLLKISPKAPPPSVFQIANELNLDFDEKLKLATSDTEKRESFILSRLKYQKHLLTQAQKSKDVFHLN